MMISRLHFTFFPFLAVAFCVWSGVDVYLFGSLVALSMCNCTSVRSAFPMSQEYQVEMKPR